MSINFAIKDLTRKWGQYFSYVKTISVVTAVSVFFIHTFNGLGFTLFSQIQHLYNYTSYDIFSQYLRFSIYTIIAISVIWIVIVNHSILSSKSRDISIMKAVGTLKKNLNSFYMTELLIIDVLGMIFGILLGFIGYLVLFFVYSFLGFYIIVYVDIFLVPIMVGVALICTYLINGNEMRIISNKKCAEISSSDTDKNFAALSGLRFFPNLLSKMGLKFKISVTNLIRKKKLFYRMIVLTASSLTILLTLAVGGLLIGNTVSAQIDGSQNGENYTILIGHNDVVDHIELRYNEFSNSSLNYNLENLTKAEYLFNSSVIDSLENNNSDIYKDIQYWDRRLFVYIDAEEIDGIFINFQGNVSDGSSYTVIGQKRKSIIPVVGLEFKEYIDTWEYFGSIENATRRAVIGDTLAHDFFDSALNQSIELQGVNPKRYEITGIYFDSFCAGNATYVLLSSIQEDLGLQNKINYAFLSVNKGANVEELIQTLTEDFQNLGLMNFKAISLSSTFDANLRSINLLNYVIYLLIAILIFIIVQSLVFYQKAIIHERIKDLSIIRALGGNKKLIMGILFNENLIILLISMVISLGGSLIINRFLIGETAIFPPLLYVIVIWLVISAIIICIDKLSLYGHYKEIKTKMGDYVKIFHD